MGFLSKFIERWRQRKELARRARRAKQWQRGYRFVHTSVHQGEYTLDELEDMTDACLYPDAFDHGMNAAIRELRRDTGVL